MKVQQCHYVKNQWKTNFTNHNFNRQQAQLVLAFGDPGLITNPELFNNIKKLFPKAKVISCSTAGEIMGNDVYDHTIAVTAIQFEKTKIRTSVTNVRQHSNSHEVGKYLMKELQADDLASVFVISDGTHINGSELVAGLNANNPRNLSITGGLAGDGARFVQTFVGLDELAVEGMIAAIGFYGHDLKIGHGSFGGWDEFGQERTITRSEKNILYEIDGRNALDLYKEYLGHYQDELPGSALLFPLSLKEPHSNEYLVRTILSINEQEKSMCFAGNLPQGSRVRLMKANFDRLIDGSSIAAQNCSASLLDGNPELAILISCVGRKLILQDRTDEEVLAVKKVFGNNPPMAGFYSYGEISPFNPRTKCELHNQTMTITTFSES